MKKSKKMTITKIAAAAMAVMLAGAAVPMTAAMPVYAVSGAAASDEGGAEMKEALTKVKQRVAIPEELSEFTYRTNESYGTKAFTFEWRTPDNAEKYQQIYALIVGDIIIEYGADSNKPYSIEPQLAKLTEEEILAKAKESFFRLEPTLADKDIRFELDSLSLFGDYASVTAQRYENGVKVDENYGNIDIDKNTGELFTMNLSWWDNAKFTAPKNAKTEEEIKEAYKKLCSLTPHYSISVNWETKKKTARIVYEPDFTSEIDAFTGETSTLWEDMKEADGTRYYGYYEDIATGASVEYDAGEVEAEKAEDGVAFTDAELKKIQQNEKLLTAEQVFELLKKDKYAALTNDYEIRRYDIYSDKRDNGVMPLAKDSAVNKKEEKETFYMSIRFTAKDKNYKGYKDVSVTLNAETGEIISLSRGSNPTKLVEFPKLDVEKANAIAEGAAKQFAKDIFGECKPDADNKKEAGVWNDRHETSRSFRFNRFVNGIRVSGDYINVTVDSNGVVTNFYYNYTDDVQFPSADILTPDEALDKLYTQRNFDYYYTGWIAKDGKVNTYLVYKMGYFYLNAKTGQICAWNGEPLTNYSSGRNVKYTDIKGIPQEQAILAMQKYGIVVTKDSKFKPNEVITKEEFSNLLSSALHGYYSDVPEMEGEDYEAYKAEQKKPATRTDAAVIFTKGYDNGKLAELKGIYKTPFSDVKSNDENIGAIAIAYGKGFIPKGDGKFGGDRQITRAEAVQMIYDYLVYITK